LNAGVQVLKLPSELQMRFPIRPKRKCGKVDSNGLDSGQSAWAHPSRTSKYLPGLTDGFPCLWRHSPAADELHCGMTVSAAQELPQVLELRWTDMTDEKEES